FQAEDGIRDRNVTGVQTCALPISEPLAADDLLWRNGGGKWFRGKRIHNPNTHGTGCTLSSAIASNLAKGFDLDTSVERAKAYIRSEERRVGRECRTRTWTTL